MALRVGVAAAAPGFLFRPRLTLFAAGWPAGRSRVVRPSWGHVDVLLPGCLPLGVSRRDAGRLQSPEVVWVGSPREVRPWAPGLFCPASPRRVPSRGEALLSARNQFKGIVKSVKLGEVMAEVVVTVGNLEVVSAITRTSAETLGLKPGDSVPLQRSVLPDGKRLAWGSEDKTVKVWDTRPLEVPQ